MTITEVGFEAKPQDDKPEPLKMEHFYFPLGIWMVGTLISMLCFLAEIIKHRKSKTEMTMLRLEDLTKDTP